ncbi:hypothetical protein DW987_10135 [Ruminococcus sp. AM50-15BH]|nr:hypothetical protein DW987_10135 [Ruminococcus sp. AM50-15BH]
MQGIFQKENTDKALKYGIYRHLPTYEKIIRNLVSFYIKSLSYFQVLCSVCEAISHTIISPLLPPRQKYRIFHPGSYKQFSLFPRQGLHSGSSNTLPLICRLRPRLPLSF